MRSVVLCNNQTAYKKLAPPCREQNYLLNVPGVDATRRFGRLQPDGIALTLREGASSGDVLTAILQAEILRQFRRGGGQECTKNVCPYS